MLAQIKQKLEKYQQPLEEDKRILIKSLAVPTPALLDLKEVNFPIKGTMLQS